MAQRDGKEEGLEKLLGRSGSRVQRESPGGTKQLNAVPGMDRRGLDAAARGGGPAWWHRVEGTWVP